MGFDGTGTDQLLRSAVDGGTFSGVAAIVVDRDGVLYEGTAGEAGQHTMFRIASMTKALATTGALQLVEQGRLDLDATVESILPQFGELQVLEGFDGDVPRLRAPRTQATIRQLATHTAGCGYFFTNENLFPLRRADRAAESDDRLEGEPDGSVGPRPWDDVGVRHQH